MNRGKHTDAVLLGRRGITGSFIDRHGRIWFFYRVPIGDIIPLSSWELVSDISGEDMGLHCRYGNPGL